MMSCIATIGKCGITTRPSFTNQQINSVIPEKTDARFLYYVFTQLGYEMESAGGGGSIYSNVSKSRFADINVMIPDDINEQRFISHILGALDDKIELNRKVNETLEAMAGSLFKSWFVDFDPVRAKVERRDTGLLKEIADLFPDSLEESELGEIPKGWKVSCVGNISEVIDCLHSKKPERRESGKPLLQLENIKDDGLIDLTDKYFIGEEDYKKWITRMEARPSDCVITNVGRVGAVAQMAEGQIAALGRNMTGIRCLPDFPYPTVLIECLLSDAMRREIESKTDSGTILNALNVRSIPKLRFVQSNSALLVKFEQIVRPLRQQMEINKSEMGVLSTLRDALLPKLISGELRVDDSSKFVRG